MAKAKAAKKPAAIPATDENVERTAKSKQIKELVTLAGLFVRIGARGPLEVAIPVFASVELPDKEDPAKRVYRKHQIPMGTLLEPEFVRLGKREGLIFRFKPKTEVLRQNIKIEAIEMNWDDVVGVVPEAVQRLDVHFKGMGDNAQKATAAIRDLNNALMKMIGANPGMHKLLNDGFTRAQDTAAEDFKEEQLEGNELYGQWG